MAQVTNVCIGIQARSTSDRFPRKIYEMIGDKPMLGHVIDNCSSAAQYLNRYSFKNRITVSVALLIPYGDEISAAFHSPFIIQGPEDNVLERYRKMADRLDADYIVRVTGDCPLLPAWLISKAITVGTKNNFDYCSNVDEHFRTAPDGYDVEILSKPALKWLVENAEQGSDQEHVTIAIRERTPNFFSIGHLVGNLDESSIKISVDTPEDLERVRGMYDKAQKSIEHKRALHGIHSVHRY